MSARSLTLVIHGLIVPTEAFVQCRSPTAAMRTGFLATGWVGMPRKAARSVPPSRRAYGLLRTQGMLEPRIREFYARVMTVLHDAELPFLVAGAYALRHHT